MGAWTSPRTGEAGGSARQATSRGSLATPRKASRSPQRSRRCSMPTPPSTRPTASVSRHMNALWSTSSPSTPLPSPGWLGYLDTGAHDIVFPLAPKLSLYWGWPYLLVEAGPEQALTWRTGHMRGGESGSLPDLFFPADHSWLVSALCDDTWTHTGGT